MTLDELDRLGVPVQSRLLAALGPRMMQLAGARSLGAHPYLAPASSTAAAREQTGPGALFAQVLLFVVTDDEEEALRIGRKAIEVDLTLDNCRRSFLRTGFTAADLDYGGSEPLINALVASSMRLISAVEAHLTAGADHVTIGIRSTPGRDLLGAYRQVAELLGLLQTTTRQEPAS